MGANLGVGNGLAVDVGVGDTVPVGVDVGVEEAVLVAVDVGLGVGEPDCAQYLPPVLNLLRTLAPPQIIISLPVQTAV